MDYKKIIEETFSKGDWNYYSEISNSDFKIETADDCRDFIEKYFSISEKKVCSRFGKTLVDTTNIELLPDERCKHIVYVFLFGVYAYNNLSCVKKLVDDEIKQYINQFKCNSDVNFYFIWFLCCLFHDLGYTEEQSEITDKEKLELCKEQTQIAVPEIFKKNILKSYWKYRIEIHEKYDHGIYAGKEMYELLCKIREKKASEGKSHLVWDKKLEKIYNVASWIVLCHNIWFAQKDDINACRNYKKFNLKKLIIEKEEYKIKLQSHPLFFFFCLMDTIEPIKIVKDIDLIENIDVSFPANGNEIIINNNLKCGCADIYDKAIRGINNWLTKVRSENDGFHIELEV